MDHQLRTLPSWNLARYFLIWISVIQLIQFNLLKGKLSALNPPTLPTHSLTHTGANEQGRQILPFSHVRWRLMQMQRVPFSVCMTIHLSPLSPMASCAV